MPSPDQHILIPKGRKVGRVHEKRAKEKLHGDFIHELLCCISGRYGVVQHHLLRIPKEMLEHPSHSHCGSRKAHCMWSIPLAAEHHNHARGVHGPMGEIKYLEQYGINGPELAAALWACSGDIPAGEKILSQNLTSLGHLTNRFTLVNGSNEI